MSCGLAGPSISGSPAFTRSPACTVDVLALGDQVLLRQIGAQLAVVSGVTTTLRLPLVSLPKLTTPVDLRDDRVLLGLAGLEQLGDARETAGDVLGLGGLPRDLAMISPASMESPSLTVMLAPTGRL